MLCTESVAPPFTGGELIPSASNAAATEIPIAKGGIGEIYG